MRIIKSTDAIEVPHPVFMLFGQPGIGKSSIGYSARDPLTLDFDRGAHRAANRRDTLLIETWSDVAEITDPATALPYQSIVIDTVGRCLDLMSVDIIASNPKMGRGDGSLSLQGFGALKARFRLWVAQLRALGKDVVLLAHDKEDGDADNRIVRPDMTGGSYAEVMKISDCVGYIAMVGKQRIVDFNPTDRYIGKNPAGWAPFVLPPVAKATTFLADRIDEARAALGAMSEESAKVTMLIATWRTNLDNLTTAKDCTEAIPKIKALEPIAAPQVSKLLMDRAKALGFTYDVKSKQFVAPLVAAPVSGDDIFAGASTEGR